MNLQVRRGEIVCLAGIEGNGQTEFVYALTGLEKQSAGEITLCGKDISHVSIRQRSKDGMSHIPEDRHKHGLVLDFTLEQNMVLQRYWQPEFQKNGFINFRRRPGVFRPPHRAVRRALGPGVQHGGAQHVRRQPAEGDRRARDRSRTRNFLWPCSRREASTWARSSTSTSSSSPSATLARAVLLVSLELDEVMNVSDRILVMYEGEIVGEFDPKNVTVEELGLYMAGAKRM